MNSLNDLSSLLITYKIPILFIVSWRGTPGEDAPQHLINGIATKKVLNSFKIPFWELDKRKIRKNLETK